MDRKLEPAHAHPMSGQMRLVVDNIADGVLTIDAAQRIEQFNPAAERLFGYRSAEVIGRPLSMLVPEADRLPFGDGIGAPREATGVHKDGSPLPLELVLGEFELDGQRYFTGIVRDITARKQLEDELHRRVDDLAAADRQKNEFIALLAHELRNPLAPMRNSLHLLRMRGASEEIARHAREVLERQMQHLVRLVDDLLDVSRIIRGKIELRREVLDVAVAVARAIESARPAIETKGHELSVSLPEPAVWVQGDLERLAQIIANLLTNAAKYTDRGGRVAISVTRDGDQAVIRVRDTGVGIPAEVLPRVFDLFVQGVGSAARSQGGLGIGLTLVKRLVEMHEGSVEAHSEGNGRGSEFVVRLPAVLVDANSGDEEIPGAATVPQRRILVVDDNVDAAESIAMILQLDGYNVRCAYDGLAVLSVAREFHPDVVILDIGLPGLSGYEVARQLRDQPDFQRTLIVAVTGYGQETDRRSSKEAGIDHHLTKPVDPATLQNLLRGSAEPGLRE
jgi:PAS domain S-box-containing protein